MRHRLLHREHRHSRRAIEDFRGDRLYRFYGAMSSRQVDLERRALVDLAIDPDAAPVLIDDPEDGGEP